MNSLLAKMVEIHQRDVAFVVAAYNSSVHDSTGYSPNMLMFGREVAMAADVALGNPSPQQLSPNDYVDHVVGMLTEAYDEVRENLGRAAQKAKRYYDSKSKAAAFKPGDSVWVYNPRRFQGRSPKWQRCYAGPFTVVKQINDVNFVVRKSPKSPPQVIHIGKLKPYFPPGIDQ